MSSVPEHEVDWDFSEDTAAQGKVNTMSLDQEILSLSNQTNLLKHSLDQILDADDNLLPGIVKIINLSQEVLDLIAAGETQAYFRQVPQTGVTDGMGITQVAPTQFSVAAGIGRIADYSINTTDPTVTEVEFAGASNVNIAGPATYVAVDAGGQLVVSPTEFQDEDWRDLIVLGVVLAISGSIDGAVALPVPTWNGVLGLYDVLREIGPFLEGNTVSANGANLRVDKSSGETIGPFINWFNDPKSPSRVTSPSQTEAFFTASYQDGLGDFIRQAAAQDVPVGFYDDGSGTLAALGANDWTWQVWYYSAATDSLYVAYGQFTYPTKDAANAGLSTDFASFIEDPLFEDMAATSILLHRGGALDLSDPLDGEFVRPAGIISGGTPAGDMNKADYDPDDRKIVEQARNVVSWAENVDAGAVAKGTLVHVQGYDLASRAVQVVPADKDTGLEANAFVLGDIAAAAFGKVAHAGVIEGVDTSLFAVGQPVYLGAAGAVVADPGGARQRVGKVLRVGAADGIIYFQPGPMDLMDQPSVSFQEITTDLEVIGYWAQYVVATLGNSGSILLPPAPSKGHLIKVRNRDTGGGIDVDGNGNTIDGAATLALSASESREFLWTGSEWVQF